MCMCPCSGGKLKKLTTSNDGPWRALIIGFWLQVDQTKWLDTNWFKVKLVARAIYCHFWQFAVEKWIRSSWTQKNEDSAVHGLSDDVRFDSIDLIGYEFLGLKVVDTEADTAELLLVDMVELLADMEEPVTTVAKFPWKYSRIPFFLEKKSSTGTIDTKWSVFRLYVAL